MADWENIPRLDPALQDEIDNVQLKHNALVEAVRGYSGGSIAGKTNEVMGTHQDNLDEVAAREKTLLSAVGQPEPTPSMLLDFASQTYFTGVRGLEQAVDPHKYLTVERATSKWVMGPQGKLVEVPQNKLAYEYDPVTGEPEGVLIEESRTNLLTWSDDFTNGDWNKARATVAANAAIAPDGTETAYKLVEGTEEGTHTIHVPFGPASEGKDYTLSFYVKAAERTVAEITLAGFAIDNIGTQINLSLTTDGERSQYVGNGWHRVWVTQTAVGVGDNSDILASFRSELASGAGSYPGDGTSGIYIWGAQLEEGSTPSSYIPTEDAPVTRAADNVSRELGDEFNKQEGTIVVRISDIEKAKGQALFNLMEADRVAHGPRIQVSVDLDGGISVACVDDGGTASTRRQLNASANPTLAIAYKAGHPIVYVCDGQVTTEHANTSPTNLGLLTYSNASGARTNQMNTSVFSTEYIPIALSETELQELTANG